MPWSIRLKTGAAKAINKLDKPVRDRIKAFLDLLAEQDNPRINGKALQGKLSAYWRYRVGRLPFDLPDSRRRINRFSRRIGP